MLNFQQDDSEIFQGLYTTVVRTRKITQYVYFKITDAQKVYFSSDSGVGKKVDQNRVITLLDESLVKFYWGNLALEQLWGLHDYIKNPSKPLPEAIDVQITTGYDEMAFLFSYLLDQALFTWRSFLDFYLKYLVCFLTGELVENISTGLFRKKMEQYLCRIDDQRCQDVFDYIKSNVLCETYGGDKECWGDFLRSLRDKTAHQKLIKPTLKPKENFMGYEITWPTIQGQNYTDLVQQNFGNNAFEMMRDLFPNLYGSEWIPGPFKPGMYESK
jgi:hypothetical protein